MLYIVSSFQVHLFPLSPRMAYSNLWVAYFFPLQILLHLSFSDQRILDVEAMGKAEIVQHMRWNCGIAALWLGLGFMA